MLNIPNNPHRFNSDLREQVCEEAHRLIRKNGWFISDDRHAENGRIIGALCGYKKIKVWIGLEKQDGFDVCLCPKGHNLGHLITFLQYGHFPS